MSIQEKVILANLKQARINIGLSGDDVAKKIGKSDNSFISRIENGKQKLNLEIINKLCQIYKIDPIALFTASSNSNKTDITHKSKGFLSAIEYRSDYDELNDQARNNIKKILPTLRKLGKVMRRLGEAPIALSTFYPQSVELLKPQSIDDAKNLGKKVAVELRKYLNIGNDPIADILSLTWYLLKVPICSLDLGDNCWGLYNKDSDGNPLIIYSSSHNTKQRNIFTIAHELGHHFFSPGEISIDTNNENTNVKEKLADSFAQEFLIPSESLNNYIQEEGLLLIELKQKHIVDLCEYFKVSYLMMLTVLRDNSLINNKQYQNLRDYNSNQLKQLGYEPSKYITEPPGLDVLLNKLVAKGLRKERFSVLFASEILDITEQEVKAII